MPSKPHKTLKDLNIKKPEGKTGKAKVEDLDKPILQFQGGRRVISIRDAITRYSWAFQGTVVGKKHVVKVRTTDGKKFLVYGYGEGFGKEEAWFFDNLSDAYDFAENKHEKRRKLS